jgi:L-rhamnose mutarotase
MTVALHTRARADRVAACEAAHREVPREPTGAVPAAGTGLPVVRELSA